MVVEIVAVVDRAKSSSTDGMFCIAGINLHTNSKTMVK
jgi:hypothetical protein